MDNSAIKKILINALEQAIPDLMSSWKDISDKHGWDKDVANSVSVTVDEKSIDLRYNPDMAQKVLDLEYGYKNNAPKPAMRELSETSTKRLSEALDEALGECLKDLL